MQNSNEMQNSNSNWIRVSQESHCPICGKPDWCTVTQDGVIACCMRVEADKQAQNGGWIHYLAETPQPFFLSCAPNNNSKINNNSNNRTEPEVLAKVYAAMLDRLTLSEIHRQELLGPQRGMTGEQLKVNAYRSLPLQGRAQLAKDLTALFGAEVMTHVPGFYLNDNGHSGYYPSLAGAPGLLIPIRDVQQRITAFQIKVDREKQDIGKYTWFSSRGKEAGTSSGAPAHVAIPTSVLESQRVWITEGGLKADIACELLGETVIGVSGVSNWRAGEVLKTLQQLAVKDVVIAYDADAEKNPHVKHHAFQLACACSAKGYTVYQAEWDLHQGKGIDDLLLNGDIPTIRLWQTKNRLQKLDADFMNTILTEAPVKMPLAEARQKHYQQIRALIENHPAGIHAFTSVVGTGKTSAAMQAIKDLIKEAKWPKVKRKRQDPKTGKYYFRDEPLRLVFATDNHAAYQQWLVDEELKESVKIQQGRSPDENSPWYCHRFYDCQNHGATRHNPMVDVCQECLLKHATLVGDRMVEYWKCPYLQSMDRVKAALVVFTSKASIFNASKELKEFDVIIVDEDLFSSLWEIVDFNTDKLNDYLSGMDYIRSRSSASENIESIYPPDDEFRVFINLLKEVMATPVTPHNWIPAAALIKTSAQQNNIEIKELLASLLNREVHYQTQRYDFETPFSLHGETIYPIRLMPDLMAILLAEIDRPKGADTRLWLTVQGLKLYIPRQHLIDIIHQGKTVINLDATPNPLLQLQFPDIRLDKYDVAEYVNITQVTNSLYTKSNIAGRDYANLQKLNVALEQITASATLPVVFSHKAFDPQVESNRDNPDVFSVSNPAARYGHFDYQTRAFNGYSTADVLCIVGHYSKPINHLRALGQAVRYSPDQVSPNGPTQVLRPYWHRKPDGSGLGRWCQADPDPLIQQLIQHSEFAIYTQAIGRGRAALRHPDKPLQVYLISATPIDSLPIDKLVRLSDLSKTKANRDKPNREKFYARRDELNAERKKSAYHKVKAAIKQLLEAGKEITLNAIEKLSGVRRTLIVKLRQRILASFAAPEHHGPEHHAGDLKSEQTPVSSPSKPIGEKESVALQPEDDADKKVPECDIKMGILAQGGPGVTTLGYNIDNTPQWTPPSTLSDSAHSDSAQTLVSCDNLIDQPLEAVDGQGNNSVTATVNTELVAWARKEHGFSLGKIITAYESGYSLDEPLKIRAGLVIDDLGGFVAQKLTQIKDLDFRLPRLSRAVLKYANHLRVEAMTDLAAVNGVLNKIIAK